MNFKSLFFTIILLATSNLAQAAGLVLHTSEFGVGKFHRYDNQVHPYGASSWSPYILNEKENSIKTVVQKNQDGSYSIFYSSLESMLQEAVKISKQENMKISVLNVHGHGLPGGMWFPADEATLNSSECSSWRDAATGSDKANYDQYYSPVSKSDIMQIRSMSDMDMSAFMGCITGLKQWKAVVGKNTEIKAAMDKDAQIHFASCVVGLGKSGDNFTKGIAELLLPTDGKGSVQTSMNFGLGDWSMPKGMGFWDYVTDAQLNHDNSIYGTHREDREIAQKGTIRSSSATGGKWSTVLVADQSEMMLDWSQLAGPVVTENWDQKFSVSQKAPSKVRIPGTNAFVYLK
jgi:hypothetical protein